MPEPIHKDFREFLQLLIERKVIFMVIGGYAVAWHGKPRNTEDLDIWIEKTPENAVRIDSALREFGYSSENLSPELFLTGNIVQLGVKPWRIDIFTEVTGVEFSSCHRRRENWPIMDLKVPMISLEDLITAKKASGRRRDYVDLIDFLPPSQNG